MSNLEQDALASSASAASRQTMRRRTLLEQELYERTVVLWASVVVALIAAVGGAAGLVLGHAYAGVGSMLSGCGLSMWLAVWRCGARVRQASDTPSDERGS